MKLTQENLLLFLQTQGLKPEIQKESQQIHIVLKINTQDVYVFFVIISEGALLQLLAYLPFNFSENSQNDVARLLHLINKEIDMPGFGMDEKEKLLFYRSIIPCFDETLSDDLFDLYFKATQKAIETFMGAIGMIAVGANTFDNLMEQFKKDR